MIDTLQDDDVTRSSDHDTETTRILFQSDTLLVRAHLGRGSRFCFVVFDPMGDHLTLDRVAFGENFFAAQRYDSIHVLASSNSWYQDPGFREAVVRIRDLTRGYDRVVTYGSSMGGYAALRFTRMVGAQTAIAISPQYSMQGSFAKTEKRWIDNRKATTWLYEASGEPLPPVADAIVFYDNHSLDRPHVEAVKRDLPHAKLVPIPYAGHPAGSVLMETGIISSTIIDAAHGRLDVPQLLAIIRRERHRSGQYLFTLARRQPGWRLRTKAALAERAVAAFPNEPVYLSYAGLLQERLGQTETALARHESATRRPGFGWSEMRYAAALFRAGRIGAASLAAERARNLLSDSFLPAEMQAISRLHHSPAEALRLALGVRHIVERPRLHGLLRTAQRSRLLRRWVDGEPGRRLVVRLLQPVLGDPRYLGQEIAHADWG